MNVLHVTTVAKLSRAKRDAGNWGEITAVKAIIAVALEMGRPGAIAVDEPITFHSEVTLNYWIEAIFGLDHAYLVAHLKAHLCHYQAVTVEFIKSGREAEAVSFGPHPQLTTEEILLLFRVVENHLSPENLTGDGERPRADVRRAAAYWGRERALLVRLLGREPTFGELHPEMTPTV